MKKEVLLFSIFLLIFLPMISAASIEMKDNFSSGETLIAKVSGNFIEPITKSNVFFYEGPILDSNFQVSFEYDVIKINTDYYIYAILLDKYEGKYSLALENVRYMKGNKISEDDMIKNFSITSQTADFYVNPGMVLADADFNMEVQNLNENNLAIEVNTDTNISGAREIFIEGKKNFSFSLLSGEKKKLSFQLGSGESAMRTIQFKSNNNFTYTIPVYIPSSQSESPDSFLFSLEPSELNISLPINKVEKKVIYLYNLGNKNLTDITLTLSESLMGFVNITDTTINKLEAHSSKPVELYFLSHNQTKIYGEILAQNKNVTVSSSIYVSFSSNYTQVNETYATTKTCAELNGTVYDTKIYECDQTPFSAKDNLCCRGNLKKIKTAGPSGTLIAILLILLVVIGLVWFYFAKYRKTKRPINLIKMAQPKKF